MIETYEPKTGRTDTNNYDDVGSDYAMISANRLPRQVVLCLYTPTTCFCSAAVDAT